LPIQPLNVFDDQLPQLQQLPASRENMPPRTYWKSALADAEVLQPAAGC
jgi:hypothetical protein